MPPGVLQEEGKIKAEYMQDILSSLKEEQDVEYKI